MVLFEPIRIGGITVANRIVKSAMAEGLAEADGRATPELAKRYQRWSAGGVGLSITGMAHVLEGYSFSDREIGLYDDRLIEPLRAVTEAVHRHEGKIFVQLSHAPPQLPRAKLRALGAIAPSAGLNRTALWFNRAARSHELYAIAKAFGGAARRAREAGADGVQIHGAHGYLISRFLSPRHNRRRDHWGGSTRGRLAFVEEIYRCMRAEVGRDFPITIKLNAHDGQPGGLTLDESVRMARQLERWGMDAIEVSAGTADVGMGFYPSRGEIPQDLARRFLTDEFPWLGPVLPVFDPLLDAQRRRVALREEAYFAHEATRIAEAVSIPVIAVGGIRTRADAERLLRDTPIAMIALGRPLVRQPTLPNHWREGRHERARCVSCNRCFVHLAFQDPLRCRVLPA